MGSYALRGEDLSLIDLRYQTTALTLTNDFVIRLYIFYRNLTFNYVNAGF